MFRWTDDMIRFMADAADKTDFHRRLASELLPWLHPDDTVCDAGCGLGYLSLALAPHVRHITAAERDAAALAVLERELAARHIENVTPLCGTHGVDAACCRLSELGIPYQLKRTAFRFDQPFRSWEDARRFFEIYRRRDDASLITDELLRQRLEATGNGEFPWRLPSVRPAGIIAFDALKIQDTLHHEAMMKLS